MLEILGFDTEINVVRIRIPEAYWSNDLHRILTSNAAIGGIIHDGEPVTFSIKPDKFLKIYKVWGNGISAKKRGSVCQDEY